MAIGCMNILLCFYNSLGEVVTISANCVCWRKLLPTVLQGTGATKCK